MPQLTLIQSPGNEATIESRNRGPERGPINGSNVGPNSALNEATEGASGYRAESLTILCYQDELGDEIYHDLRSEYVERFWLSILGPSTTWLLRSIAWGLETCPEGFELPIAKTAKVLGLGAKIGKSSRLARCFDRLVQFEVARWLPQGEFQCRRSIPWLDLRQASRLDADMAQEHKRWEQAYESAQPELTKKRQLCVQTHAIIKNGGSLKMAKGFLAKQPHLTHHEETQILEWAQAQCWTTRSSPQGAKSMQHSAKAYRGWVGSQAPLNSPGSPQNDTNRFTGHDQLAA